VFANEAYKESVASVQIVQIGMSKAWWWLSLVSSWVAFRDLLDVNLPT